MTAHRRVLRVALPVPLPRLFDYWAPQEVPPAGVRVRVPFGRGTTVGVVMGVGDRPAIDPAKVRPAKEVLDQEPLLGPADLMFLGDVAAYYAHPIGEVVAAALPPLLRDGTGEGLLDTAWHPTEAGRAEALAALARAPRQRAVMRLLCEAAGPLVLAEIEAAVGGPVRAHLRALEARGYAGRERRPPPPPAGNDRPDAAPALNADQAAAGAAVRALPGGGRPLLLEGVTGSGKTEVYLHAAADALAAGRQVLMLVPEIGLTPQLVDRLRRRLAAPVCTWHSGLADGDRARAWFAARSGRPLVLVGTRSAVFTPMPALGLVVVDEEHDPSYKQQEGFRYSGRDVAVWRAHRAGVRVVLGSATPALETLHNVAAGRYAHACLPARAGGARPPATRVIDLRTERLEGGLSRALLAAVGETLARGEQAMLFLNRRGYAPTVQCPECAWIAQCARCDARLTWHRAAGRLRCHHCGADQHAPDICPACGRADLRPRGQGTERLEDVLRARFPDAPLLRLDRDAMRRRGALEEALASARDGRARLLIGTQMLAKGHDFPALTLAAIVQADHGLFGAGFRSAERFAQLFVQVSGRAGRGERPGQVLIQTRHPDHPMLRCLLERGYPDFARAELGQRRAAQEPPFAHWALLRAEAPTLERALSFLERAAADAGRPDGIDLLGPVAAPMARRAGHHRAQLLVQAGSRPRLRAFVGPWIGAIAEQPWSRRVRWSIDVDPIELD